ncbi:GntR family transcriptional regulator [Bosea sp. 117]|uniref:GntR family transcriptional regulator n=1 Tax=Bosea sp. 117 TaxID=1125973 RepID=UPI000493D118|nr:GntR family transcriptional regulator [Bosea sp. 117]
MSRGAEIARALEDDILRGARKPGDRLDERQLAEEFDVSRTPIREAIQRLVASGLVTVRGRSGAIVAELSVAELLDGFTVVANLEALAAAQAARRALPEHHRLLVEAHERCVDAARRSDVQAFFNANNDFHDTIAQISQNRVLQDLLRAATLKTSPYRHYVTYRPGRMSSSIPEHQAILDAIVAGDSLAASQRMQGHVSLLGEDLTDFLHFLQLAKPA